MGFQYIHLCDAGQACFAIEAYYKKTFRDSSTLFNKHPSYEIMYAASGRCQVLFLDETSPHKPETVLLEENRFVFIDAGTVHQLLTEDRCLLYNIEFKLVPSRDDAFSLRRFFAASPQLRGTFHRDFRYFAADDTQRVLQVIKAIHAEADEAKQNVGLLDEPSQQAMLQLLACQLLLEMSKCCKAVDLKRMGGSQYINTAMQFLNEHYKDCELRVDSIAGHVGINRTYLQKLFRLYTGKTVTAYLHEQRVNEAAYLLKNTAIPVTDIGFHVGYNSRQNFYVAFKRVTGSSPDQYRRAALNKEMEVYHTYHPSEIVSTK